MLYGGGLSAGWAIIGAMKYPCGARQAMSCGLLHIEHIVAGGAIGMTQVHGDI